MPNLIRQRRLHEVWKKPGELVQIPCNGWTFPRVFTGDLGIRFRTRSGTTPSCKNINSRGNENMFGRVTYPGTYESKEHGFRIEHDGNSFVYLRENGNTVIEKHLPQHGTSIVVHPVEPINLPREVTRCLEIVFPPVLMAPESHETVFLTFPLEYGVFFRTDEDYQLLDVFSRCIPKYSLYGTPESGVITRYHESDISGQEKESDRTRNGILRLEIRNESRGWVEVSRAVFDSYFMPIYFDTVAGMVGEMKIYSRLMAQTNILDRTFREGMEPALPIIRARKIMNIDLERKGFLMEHGVG
jgi:hypothetical protein